MCTTQAQLVKCKSRDNQVFIVTTFGPGIDDWGSITVELGIILSVTSFIPALGFTQPNCG
jgi:hypothetical protein